MPVLGVCGSAGPAASTELAADTVVVDARTPDRYAVHAAIARADQEPEVVR